MIGQATKRSWVRKMKPCGHKDAHPVCNASFIIKASVVHHQGGLIEAWEKGEKGGHGVLNKHCKIYK